MSYQVQFTLDTGEVQREELATLDEAVAVIERLHNEGGVGGVRLFREVPVKVQTVVRVSVEDTDEPAAVRATPPAAEAPAAAEPAAEEESAPAAPSEPPPGSMLLTPPPATPGPGAPSDHPGEDEPRRSLFQRG